MLSIALVKFWHDTSHRSVDQPHLEPILGNLLLKIYTLTDPGASKHFAIQAQEQLIMEVMHKGLCLERLDVRARNSASLSALADARSKGVHVNTKGLPFVGLCQKESFMLALRYKVEPQQTRRLQMQFSRLEQYEQVLSLLKSEGVVFQVSQTRSESREGIRPQTAPEATPGTLPRPPSHMITNQRQPSSRGITPASASKTSAGYSGGWQIDHASHRNEIQMQNLAVLQPVRGDPYAIRPMSAKSSTSVLENMTENSERMPPPATTNIRSIYSSGHDKSRPTSSSGFGRAQQSFIDNLNKLDSSPLPPRRELPFQRPQTAPQQTSTPAPGSPGTLIPRPATGKKQTTTARRALSSTTGNAQPTGPKRKVAQRSQSMALSPSQRPTTPAQRPVTPSVTASPAAANVTSTSWDEQNVTLTNMTPATPVSFDNLNGFRALTDVEKNKMMSDVVEMVGQHLTDDFIDLCVRLEEHVVARLTLKHMLADEIR